MKTRDSSLGHRVRQKGIILNIFTQNPVRAFSSSAGVSLAIRGSPNIGFQETVKIEIRIARLPSPWSAFCKYVLEVPFLLLLGFEKASRSCYSEGSWYLCWLCRPWIQLLRGTFRWELAIFALSEFRRGPSSHG